MPDDSLVSVFDYLQSNTGFNDENFRTLHARYIQECGGEFRSREDESEVLKEVARQLKIKLNDDDQSMALLRECITSEDEEESRILVQYKLSQMTRATQSKSNSPTPTKPITNGSSPSAIRRMMTTFTEIDCLLTIKKAALEVYSFVQSYLLKPIDHTIQQPFNGNFDQEILLHNQSVLRLFIRQQVAERLTNASDTPSNSTRFRLVEPIKLKDAFDQWDYDHLHGLFDLDLEPHTRNTSFPTRWCLSDNVSIYCRIEPTNFNGNTTSLSKSDQSTATSTEKFRRNTRSQENNDRNKDLSLLMEGSLVSEKSTPSLAELYADLHLTKLYFHHTLCKCSVGKKIEDMAKVDMKCLTHAFQEIESEIFNDDNLFQKMKEFFLPFTISEEELKKHWSSNGNIQQDWERDRDNLRKKLRELADELSTDKGVVRKCFARKTEVEKEIDEMEKTYSAIRERQDSLEESNKQKGFLSRFVDKKVKQGKRNKEEIEALHQKHRQCKRRRAELEKKLSQCEQEEMDASKKVEDLENQIEENNASLKRIITKLDKTPGPVDTQLVKPPRGLILYGPPGTGKSDILKKLARKLGITLVSQPLSAGELNRPLVGQSEEILNALGARCSHIPYAMCALAIDEIDSLAPKRREDSSEGKIDKISVLLSLIEGIKDVSNLMIFSATNRLHMMDEAFLRRMSGKFFVGRPSPNSRTSMLEKIPFWALDPELLDLLSIVTTNFSGAAVKALARAITIRCIKMNNAKPISEMDALKLAEQTAQHHQIYIGSETLPGLRIRNQQVGLHHPIHSLSSDKKYTGRIIVDLHEEYIRMEVLESRPKTNEHILSVIEHKLDPNETNVQTSLERLTEYGKSCGVQLLQLIDLNLLASQSAYDQTKIYETLKDRYDEYVSYSRSMIIYDLDTLVGVNQSENGSGTGASISYSINNQSIYAYVLSRFRDRVMEDDQEKNTDQIQRWAVAIIREPYLLRRFVDEVQFPLSRREEEELQMERRLAEELLQCVKCHDFYNEKENRIGSCSYHDGFLYDISTAELERCTPSEAMKKLNKLERDAFQNSNSSITYDRQKTKFKWICCNETFSGTCKGGCKRNKHGFLRNEYRSSSRATCKRKINPSQQGTIEQWENACLSNEEYEEKWVALCEDA